MRMILFRLWLLLCTFAVAQNSAIAGFHNLFPDTVNSKSNEPTPATNTGNCPHYQLNRDYSSQCSVTPLRVSERIQSALKLGARARMTMKEFDLHHEKAQYKKAKVILELAEKDLSNIEKTNKLEIIELHAPKPEV